MLQPTQIKYSNADITHHIFQHLNTIYEKLSLSSFEQKTSQFSYRVLALKQACSNEKEVLISQNFLVKYI